MSLIAAVRSAKGWSCHCPYKTPALAPRQKYKLKCISWFLCGNLADSLSTGHYLWVALNHRSLLLSKSFCGLDLLSKETILFHLSELLLMIAFIISRLYHLLKCVLKLALIQLSLRNDLFIMALTSLLWLLPWFYMSQLFFIAFAIDLIPFGILNIAPCGCAFEQHHINEAHGFYLCELHGVFTVWLCSSPDLPKALSRCRTASRKLIHPSRRLPNAAVRSWTATMTRHRSWKNKSPPRDKETKKLLVKQKR